MDYEKAYKDALDRARKMMDSKRSVVIGKQALETIFPELAESEDERILASIADCIGLMGEDGDVFSNHNVTKVQVLSWLKKQKEQKPAEWSEDYREEDIQTRFAFYTYKDDSSVLYLSNVFVEEASRNHGFGTRILKAAEKVAETIGATTISLKVKQDSPANAWYRKNGYGYVAFEDGYDWLEKNLEYMKPNKQEWSEEDGLTIADLINFFEGDPLNCSAEEMVQRIKSLRPSWRPSKEQLVTLLRAEGIVRVHDTKELAADLARLYEQLKKL